MSEWEDVLNKLEIGDLRSAQPPGQQSDSWKANQEVKQAILEAFKAGQLTELAGGVDKSTIAPRKFSVEDGVRIVPQGQSVRRGAYVAPGVIIMPPSYINIGAYVSEGVMVDSHVLVGSCAQIGKRVHLSAGVQIGGVLEPIGQTPVVIEDDVFVGAGAIIVEGILVKSGAVIAPGTILSRGTPLYDCINKKRCNITDGIPERAVVISGTRKLNLPYAESEGLAASCALIIKYRDQKTDASLELETLLR